VLAILSVAAALGAGEIGVRVLYRDVTTTSPIESWFGLRWKREHLRRNRFGFRDGEFSLRKPPGVYRIVVVGDSFTAAMGIPEEERYTERIEAALGAARGRVEVLQFANPGAELDDHVATLRAALAVAPDFVLLQWYVNDVEIGKQGQPRPRHLAPWPGLHRALFAHSALYAILDQQWAWMQVRLGLTPSYEAYMQARFGDPHGEDSRRADAELRAFFEVARGAGVPVAVVLFPHLDDRLGGSEYPFAFLHERVLAACAEASVPCVDLRDTFARHAGNVALLRVNRFDHHAGALAHRLATERLLEVLGPVWRARASSS
jgi:hypothetical protein